jgi:hypothetical protein
LSHEQSREALAAWRGAEVDRRAKPSGSAERNAARLAVERARLAYYAAIAGDAGPTEAPGEAASPDVAPGREYQAVRLNAPQAAATDLDIR